MKNLNKKPLDKNTVGKSPAAVYLMEVLDNTTSSIDKKVLKKIDSFQGLFKSFVVAYEAGHLPGKSVKNFIQQKKIVLDIEKQEMEKLGYSSLVIGLYANVIHAEMKKFSSKASKISNFEKNAKDRARDIVKQQGSQLDNQTISTFGQLGEEIIPVEVSFNKYGQIKAVLDKKTIKDNNKVQILNDKAAARRIKRESLGG